jgi:hypothetical protein
VETEEMWTVFSGVQWDVAEVPKGTWIVRLPVVGIVDSVVGTPEEMLMVNAKIKRETLEVRIVTGSFDGGC